MTEQLRLPAPHSLLLPETAKPDLPWDRRATLPRAEMILVMWQAPPQLLLRANSQSRANLLARARQLGLQEKSSDFVSQPAKQRLVKPLVAQTKPRDLFLHSQRQQLREPPLQVEQDSPLRQVRERQYSRCPGPFAFSRETQAARKCNRAARCGDYPNRARCRPRRNRRALAGCDNKCSRSQHRLARRVRTFLIAAADKCRCLPRRIADSDIRSAKSE
jgi:hypothetical protein